MQRLAARVCLSLILVLTPSTLGITGVLAAVTAWTPLCLQPRDVPSGFTLSGSHPITNADLIAETNLPPSVVTDLGRIGGYRTTYQTASPKGIYYVSDDVSQFTSAIGAETFDALAVRLEETGRRSSGLRLLPNIRVGDYAWAYTIPYYSHGYTYPNVTIHFHRGSFEVGVEAMEMPGTRSVSPLIDLARIIDGRLMTRTGNPSTALHVSPAGRVPFLTLQTTDLDRGYRIEDRFIGTNGIFSAGAPISRAEVERHGRVWAFAVQFETRSTAQAAYIDSSVTAFTSVAGSIWGYAHLERYEGKQRLLQRKPSERENVHTVAVPPIGDQSGAYSLVYRTGTHTTTVDVIFWRRGVYNAAVDLATSSSTVCICELVHLAQVQDARMREYG